MSVDRSLRRELEIREFLDRELGEQAMAKTVIVVCDEATLYDVAATHPTTPGEQVEIVLDRRVGPRRREGGAGSKDERRRSDRRVNQDAQARLQRDGFTIVQK